MKKFRLLRADEIECRISTVSANGVSLLLYKDARCDMNILDETVGYENWQRKHEVINNNLFCSVGIRASDGEWIWKQDVGTESYTEKEKGEASDSFKRACFNFGIGRELYSAPFIWISAKASDKPDNPNGATVELEEYNGKKRYTCHDRFSLKSIEYDDKECISGLEIVNTKTRGIAYSFGKKAEKEANTKPEKVSRAKKTADPIPMVTQRHIDWFKGQTNKSDVAAQVFLDYLGSHNIPNAEALTLAQANDLGYEIKRAVDAENAKKAEAEAEEIFK